MALTDIEIKSAKAGARIVKLSDGKGLQLHVMPTGSKLWRYAFRFHGVQKTLALGSYPDITLAAARRLHAEAMDLLATGVDPAAAKQATKRRAATEAGNTFNTLADELIAKKRREKLKGVTISRNEWLLASARQALGTRPIKDITAGDILSVLREVEKRERYDTALRLRATIGQVFRLAVAIGVADNDPTFALRGALTVPKAQHRAAIVDPIKFGGLLRAIDALDGLASLRAAMQLIAILYPRPGELRLAKWSEFDLQQNLWSVPKERMKQGEPHFVPLPKQAIAIPTDLRARSPRAKGDLVFPGARLVTRPLSENTMNATLRRLGFTADEMTAHGFRATASTLLRETGQWRDEVIEKSLAHKDSNEVRRAYNRQAYWRERVEMAQWWADKIDALKAKA
jgi:integrase